MTRIVVKIGGSVLFSPHSLEKITTAIKNQYRDCSLYLIVGGGDTIEAMRTLHSMRPELDSMWMHWRCIELLDATWRALLALVPFAIPVPSTNELYTSLDNEVPAVYAVQIASFYNESLYRPQTDPLLPIAGWDTTTDALAWYLAYLIEAKKLLLLKSCDIKPMLSIAEAANAGIVDRELERLSHEQPKFEIEFLALKHVA